ncbi:uncharacterized protein LOC126734618 [Anthonomus grandis grandis]|uniref:uncharacterized protein LOC126734618 n=1 Tax=Anthonomus grandis grandis TaxID=2921223 RepID=UPI002165634A|nr:uncharacterized protein LOC126734618 [Anthonomus grandis grandis]
MDRRASTKPLTEKELQRIAENLSDIEDDIADFESESEGEEEVIEEDCYNSESEQSANEFSEETETFVRPNKSERFYIGKNEETIWKSTPVIHGNKTKAKNIIKVLPGSKGAAKSVSKLLDSFFLFLTRDMVDHIVLCTNIYIKNKRDNFIRDRDSNFFRRNVGIIWSTFHNFHKKRKPRKC